MNGLFAFVYRYRGVLMAPPFLVLLFVFYGEVERPWLIWPLGLALFFAGVLIRLWAQVHLHYRLRVHKCLTKTGPYAIVRNPIYIGNTLMLVASAVMAELVWFVPVMLLWCVLVYRVVVRYEESHLAQKYGQPYLDYLATVPRWLPRLALWSQPAPENRNREFYLPSIAAEVHCLFLLIPLIGKELLSHW